VDYESTVALQPKWWTIHACKDPYHRTLLGYTSHAAPKDHPEYLSARREKRLFLNIVDAHDPDYIPKEAIDKALAFIAEGLQAGEKVLVHCNQGESRSPSIGLLYLAGSAGVISKATLAEAEEDFRRRYPPYNPNPGMRGFLERHWNHYMGSQ